MGRTNVVLDDKLVEKCLKTTGIKTRKELIDYALNELLRRKRQKQLLKLKGKIEWNENLNAWRQRRF